VSTPETVLLGAIAGATIFLGLPVGRLRDPRPALKAFLNAASAGILLFLLVEILQHSFAPLEGAVSQEAWGRLAGLGTVFTLGLAAGLLSLLYLGRWQRSRRAVQSAAGPAPPPDASGRQSLGPGAMAAAERGAAPADLHVGALQLGMSIAMGIGLHNFSEGLAIGQAASGGQVRLAVLLVVGFALHNATEGFGIVGPLAAGGQRPSWSYLLIAGLIAGGPTFLGTLVGTVMTSDYLAVLFLTLAAGAIVYVIAELLNVGRRLGAWDVTVWGVLAGFLVGAATELVIVAAGA
jgi:ZIP family zinc transporter